MSDLETLKAQHPEWCFNCGALFRDQYEVEHHHDANMCPWRDPNMAMLALLQQHEATIAELKGVVQRALDGLVQTACFTCGAEPGSNIDCPGCMWVADAREALDRHSARVESEAKKEE